MLSIIGTTLKVAMTVALLPFGPIAWGLIEGLWENPNRRRDG